jgi:hypothetical protein
LGPHSAYLKDVRNKSPLRAGDASKSHHAVTYVDEAAPEWFDTDDDAAKFLRANWPESDKRFPLVGEAAQEWDPLHIPDLVNAMLPGPDVTGYDAMALFTALLGRGTDKRAAPETSERALAAERGVSRHEIRTFAGSLAEMIETALALFAPALEAEPTIPPL